MIYWLLRWLWAFNYPYCLSYLVCGWIHPYPISLKFDKMQKSCLVHNVACYWDSKSMHIVVRSASAFGCVGVSAQLQGRVERLLMCVCVEALLWEFVRAKSWFRNKKCFGFRESFMVSCELDTGLVQEL